MKKRAITYISILVLAANMVIIQAQTQHELSVYGGGGLSTLRYKTDVGAQKNGFGGQFGLGYTYFFTGNLGISSGAELGLYNAQTKVYNFAYSYMSMDRNNDDFELRTRISNMKEKQRAILLQIPLMLRYQSGDKISFSGALGAKVGIPVSTRYKTGGAAITNSGYYAHEDYEYTEQAFMGFGNFTAQNMDADIDLKLSVMLSAEAGVKWALGAKTSLYTGIYFDYGLNNSKDGDIQQLLPYNTQQPTTIITNSVLTSQYGTRSVVDKVYPMALGVKVGLIFGFGKDKGKSEKPTLANFSSSEEDRALTEKAEARNKAEQAEREAKEKAEAEARRKAEQAERQARERKELETKEQLKAEEAQLKAEHEYREIVTTIETPVTGYSIEGTAVPPSQQPELNEKARLLNGYPSIHVVIEGHACNLGTNAINEKIGLKRAEAAANYLKERGIQANRISVVSKGANEPLVPNTSEENRRKNRRIVVKVL